MGQIISSLINFFLEIGRSGEQYKTRRNKSKATVILMVCLIVLAGYTSVYSFKRAYITTKEIVLLKEQLKVIDELRHDNEVLRIRNEILAQTLSVYIGKQTVNTINTGNEAQLLHELSSPRKNKIERDTDKTPE